MTATPTGSADEQPVYRFLAAREAYAMYGKRYADYIEEATAEHVAKGFDVGGQSLGEALAGNDGD